MTARDMIAGALRLLGVYGAGDTIEDQDLTDGLLVLNELLNEWNAQHWTVYTIVNRLLPIAAGTGTYTIGTGATWDVPRPVKIESAGVVNAQGLRQDLKIDTSVEFAAIPEKNAQAKLPLRLYINNDFPVAKVQIWPVPKIDQQLDLNVWDELTDDLTLDDPLDLPPAYNKAIRFNLALALAPEYGLTGNQNVVAIAGQSKAELFGLNQSNSAGTQDPPEQQAA